MLLYFPIQTKNSLGLRDRGNELVIQRDLTRTQNQETHLQKMR